MLVACRNCQASRILELQHQPIPQSHAAVFKVKYTDSLGSFASCGVASKKALVEGISAFRAQMGDKTDFASNLLGAFEAD